MSVNGWTSRDKFSVLGEGEELGHNFIAFYLCACGHYQRKTIMLFNMPIDSRVMCDFCPICGRLRESWKMVPGKPVYRRVRKWFFWNELIPTGNAVLTDIPE
mgnify:CR=1 FL=1